MPYYSVHNDFIFIEGEDPSAQIIGPIEYNKYKHKFYNQQLLTLNDIKAQLISEARNMGANAIQRFTYGQKSTSWFRSLFLALDDNVNWYANGIAVILPTERVQEIKKNYGAKT